MAALHRTAAWLPLVHGAAWADLLGVGGRRGIPPANAQWAGLWRKRGERIKCLAYHAHVRMIIVACMWHCRWHGRYIMGGWGVVGLLPCGR